MEWKHGPIRGIFFTPDKISHSLSIRFNLKLSILTGNSKHALILGTSVHGWNFHHIPLPGTASYSSLVVNYWYLMFIPAEMGLAVPHCENTWANRFSMWLNRNAFRYQVQIQSAAPLHLKKQNGKTCIGINGHGLQSVKECANSKQLEVTQTLILRHLRISKQFSS